MSDLNKAKGKTPFEAITKKQAELSREVAAANAEYVRRVMVYLTKVSENVLLAQASHNEDARLLETDWGPANERIMDIKRLFAFGDLEPI